MTDKQLQRRCLKYAQEECANCHDGQCLPMDCPCFAYAAKGWVCNYFLQAVLPRQKALENEVMLRLTVGEKGVKRNKKLCGVCKSPFFPSSNRNIYCPDCSALMKRKRAAERQRKKYWRDAQKPHALEGDNP